MGTYVDGIGASQNIDSSGEIVDIAGLDISSLEVDGSLNWEHKKDVPDQLVGKVLKAKKIFSVKDCEDDRQKYFWEKCKVPYLYVLGELFDDYTDSARTVAGLFRYDLDHRGKNAKDVVGFSVEGATIHKNGNTITRSIARKITCTSLPCNKMAVAEMVPKEGKKPKDNLDNIFKTESYVDIEVVNFSKQANLWEMLKAESLMKRAKALFGRPVKKDEQAMTSGANTSMALGGSAPSSPSLSCSEPDMAKAADLKLAHPANGVSIGKTKSGADVMSHAKVGSYKAWSSQDHKDAAEHHKVAAQATKDPKIGSHHWNKSLLHHSAAQTVADKRARTTVTPKMVSGVKKSETLVPGEKSDSVEANQKQQRDRRAIEAYPNNSKRKFDKHSINHSESNPQNVKRASIPNQQIAPSTKAAGGPSNNMLHNNILAPKRTMHKAAGGVGGAVGGIGAATAITSISPSSVPNPKPKQAPVGKITKALEAGSALTSPNNLTGGAALGKESLEKCNCNMAKCATCGPKLAKGGQFSGNVPKDAKIKELQTKIDSGTYKPDPKKIAEGMLKHPSKPLKKNNIEMPKEEFLEEHRELLDVLDHPTTKRIKHEHDKQAKEAKREAGLKHSHGSMKKSEALQRAEAEYASWEKREEFEKFMKSRMPHMTKGEIIAFGQAMVLNKSSKMEKSLNGLLGLIKEEPKK